ncbi:hypothetical protein [Caballeronia cordobensis]|nr:hypothetical protein [Caballeronia cordobensis]
MMNVSSDTRTQLKLSQPAFADGEIHFSAFGLGWDFCSHADSARLAIQGLGAKDMSPAQLRVAFELNRHRITVAAVEFGVCDPRRRVTLSKI